jgi:GDP-mannose 6-dehydrogenase
MNIIIFGAGYVGTVTGACLSKCGHSITFIEPNPAKVQALNAGQSPILEPGLEELISEGILKGNLQARLTITDELSYADMAMIAVPTPSSFSGALQLHFLEKVLKTLIPSVEKRKRPLVTCIRSTIHPLALKTLLQDCKIDSSSKISIVVNPEFLRESTAVSDFFHAPFAVAGGTDSEAVESVLSLYKPICPKRFSLSLEATCLLKYSCNAFHAMKIAFANEIGSICESLEIDPLELMNIFTQDQILNCSPAYLKPGFSFGGSCLPKDLRALLSLGRELEKTLPLLSSILPSNQLRFQRVLSRILQEDYQILAVLGMSFKKNNDDIRESPFVELIESLLGKGIHVRIFDPDVRPDRLLGSNLESFKLRVRHLSSYLKSNLSEALEECDGIVLCKDLCSEEFQSYLQINPVPVYDLQYFLTQRKEELCAK